MEATRRLNHVLFRAQDEEEGLLIGCYPTEDAGLCVYQASAGALTAWCFGSPLRVVEIQIAPRSTAELVNYFRVETISQLCSMFTLVFGDCGGALGIERLLERLELPYSVVECPIFEG